MQLNNFFAKALYGMLALGLSLCMIGADNPPAARASLPSNLASQAAGDFRDFGPIDANTGWVLTGNRLKLTTTNGLNWSDITPPLSSTATIQAVRFLNSQAGWVLWSDNQANGSLLLQLAHTTNQGKNWNNLPIQTLAQGDPDADIESASVLWLDANIGWVSIKRRTGSNFSSGTLFRTSDGGLTWLRLVMPIGGPVYFVNSTVGWLAGGPAGDQLFKSRDAGSTWQAQSPPSLQDGFQRVSILLPAFDSPENGLLATVTLNGQDFQLELYSTWDGGQNWQSITNIPLGSQAGGLPLSLLDGGDLLGTLPNSNQIIQMVNGVVKTANNQDGNSAGIVDLKMLTADFGWAKWNLANCTTRAAGGGSSAISCSTNRRLIETQNGGITWNALTLPAGLTGQFSNNLEASSTSFAQVQATGQSKTLLQVGQGFDICTIPTLAQLQTWWNYGPYKSVNLYIGGSARACANPTLTATYVAQMRAQGWTFIPTWVGPQAPCTTYSSRFSYDNSYAEGRDQAFAASMQLAALGLTNADMSGSVVYYDLEIYGNDSACREAAKDFINGWVSHMHDFGNLAGVYGGTMCTSGLTDFQAIPNIPDAIWPARWYLPAGEGTYDPNASVWDIGSCIAASSWSNHQRLRQYAGDHSETWGGTPLGGIDSNVLDGPVAVPDLGTPSANFTASPVSGKAPLSVTFTILNTAFMTSCSWTYGDGQTGNSCASTNTHVYTNPGTYTVSLSVGNSWGTSDSLTSSNLISVTSPVDHFAISSIVSPQTAGAPVTGITLTAQDPGNATVTSFTGTVTYSGTAGITGTSAAFSAGQLTGVSVTPSAAGTARTFTVTGSGKTGSRSFDVNPGGLDHFAISAITSPQTAGASITGISLTAQDFYNNTVTSFAGTVTYSGTAGITGTSAAFSAGLLTGVSVTPSAVGSARTFIVTGSGKTGSRTFNVNPGALDHFAISAIASPQTAGVPIPGVTLTAQDLYNNTVTSFTGSVTYSGTAGITGTSPIFTAGQLTSVSVTPSMGGSALTFIVTGSGKTGSQAFDVNPGALDHFAISAIASPQAAGVPITGVTLTAQDHYNNMVTSFIGTVTYSGTAGITGTSSAFTAGQLSGMNVTPSTVGSARTFIVTGSGKTGSRTFDVNPGALDHFAISTIASPQMAGVPITGITLTAQDIYNNTVSGFTGAVTYSGTAGITGTSSAFSAGQLTGVSVTPTEVGSGLTFIVTNSGKTGSRTFDVSPKGLDHFAISVIASPQTAGIAISGITLTAQDNSNNIVTSFVGTVTYSGTAGITGTSPAFSAGQLTGVSVTPTVAGSARTLIVSGSGKTGSRAFDVNPGALDHFAISAIASPQAAGVSITGITLTAQDIYNNTVPGFTGTVTYSGTAGITGTSPAFSAGQLTGVSVAPSVVGSARTFIVTGSGKTGSQTFDVINSTGLDHFAISVIPSPQTVRVSIQNITLTAQDITNKTVTSFNGTVTYSGTAGITGTSSPFAAGQLIGVYVTPIMVGSARTFVVSDPVSGKSGSRTFDVNPGPLDHFAISAISSPQMVGVAITGLTLTAQDYYNNTVTSFTGTVTYSGTAGISGTSHTFASGQLSSVSVTPIVAGSARTLIVTGSGKTGSRTFDVNPYNSSDYFRIFLPVLKK